MAGVDISFTDIESAISSFMSIPAVPAIVAGVLALGIVPIIVGALRSIVGR